MDFLIKFKGEERQLKNKIVEYKRQLHAHNGSGFHTWNVLNNLSCDKNIVDNFRNRKDKIFFGVFNGYIQNITKQIPHNLIFRCGMTYLNYSLKKIGKTFKLQKELLKTEMNQDEVYSDTWKDKKSEWLDYVKNDVLFTVFSYAWYTKAMEKQQNLA